MDKYCYNSPWCEPGEKCCCEAYAKHEAEENEKIDLISDSTIVTILCWTIAGLFGLMVAKELFIA